MWETAYIVDNFFLFVQPSSFIRSMNSSVFLSVEVVSLWNINFLLKFPGLFQVTSYRETMFLDSSESDSVIAYPGGNFGDSVFFLLPIVSLLPALLPPYQPLRWTPCSEVSGWVDGQAASPSASVWVCVFSCFSWGQLLGWVQRGEKGPSECVLAISTLPFLPVDVLAMLSCMHFVNQE